MIAAHTLAPASGAGGTAELFGLARVGEMYLALPIGAIREVVPFTGELAAMASTMPQLLGAIDLRGALVPVLDLAALLRAGGGAAAGGERPPIVMVLRVGGMVVGVCMDEICGVVALPREGRTELVVRSDEARAGAGLVLAGFSHSGRTGVILDTEAFKSLPGIALAEDRMVAAAGRSERGEPSLLVSIGDIHLGLPASAIEATVPRGPITPSVVDDPLWTSRVNYSGALIPVVDTLHLLGLGKLDESRESACVLLRIGEGRRVALRIDGVLDMLRIQKSDRAEMQGCQFDGDALIAGLYPAERPVLLLDGEALCRHPELQRLSGLEERDDAAQQKVKDAAGDAGAATGASKPYLIFPIGDGHHAVPLDQVTEILNYSECALVDLAGGAGPSRAILSHRGLAVPVLDLAALLAAPPVEDPAFLLLVSDGSLTSAFPLPSLCAVERHVARAVGSASGRETGIGPVVRTHDGVTCGVLDLAGAAARLLGPASGLAA